MTQSPNTTDTLNLSLLWIIYHQSSNFTQLQASYFDAVPESGATDTLNLSLLCIIYHRNTNFTQLQASYYDAVPKSEATGAGFFAILAVGEDSDVGNKKAGKVTE